MRLYYFTSSEHAVSNIELQRIKVSIINELNDPFELLAADLLDPRHRNAFFKFKNELNKSTGIISFSASKSNPLLWGHYAVKHTGMALGFHITDGSLHEVNYTSNRPKFEFDEKSQKIINGQKLVGNILRTKFLDWKYEEEHRLYVNLEESDKSTGLYFQKFTSSLILKEVILGLKCLNPIEEIRELKNIKNTDIKVSKAGMALRSFKVIEDRDYRKVIKSI